MFRTLCSKVQNTFKSMHTWVNLLGDLAKKEGFNVILVITSLVEQMHAYGSTAVRLNTSWMMQIMVAESCSPRFDLQLS